MNYKIINSGSDGNAVLINGEILIDCGVSFSKLEDYYKDLKLVLLTHIHCDHFNEKTIRKLSKLRPTLRFGCCEWLKDNLINIGINERCIDVYMLNRVVTYPCVCSLEPFELYHDVPQCGYKLFKDGKSYIYATDTRKIDHIKAENYDVYLIEANYENEEELKGRAESLEYYNRVLKTHLSKEKATEWLLKNMGDNSQYEFMHQHKDKQIAKRFIEIESLLNEVKSITGTPYELNDYNIKLALEELIDCYKNAQEEIRNYNENYKLIEDEWTD